jgi:hypothetical protein
MGLNRKAESELVEKAKTHKRSYSSFIQYSV